MEKIDVEIMQDASEIVHYDATGIPLYIRVGELSFYPGKKALCHWHEDIEFIRILKGEMNYYINGRNVLLKEKDGIMVNARQLHYGYSVSQRNCTFICVLFHPSLLSANKPLYRKYVQPVLENRRLEYLYLDSSHKEASLILSYLDQICALKDKGETGYELEIAGLLHLLWRNVFLPAQGCLPEEEDPKASDIRLQKDMVSYIYQHFSEKITLEDIAASGGVCRSKCCRIFRHYLRQSPIDFMNTYRLEVSSYLLKNTDKTITQIAVDCGFNHLSYFSELFARHFKCTPREYRQRASISSSVLPPHLPNQS